MEWPWRRFESMFAMHLKRKYVAELRQMRDMMLAAIISNPNWDDPKNAEPRQERVDAINEGYVEAAEIVYSGKVEEKAKPHDDPMFNVLRAQGAGMHAAAQSPQMPEAGMGREILDAA